MNDVFDYASPAEPPKSKISIPNFEAAFCHLSVFGIEKIKLSWEISTLYNNSENIKVELEKLKDLNLKLTTQYHLENSPAIIEKIAKEDLGMTKKRPKKINYE